MPVPAQAPPSPSLLATDGTNFNPGSVQKDAKSMNFSALPTFASKEDERRQGLEDLAGALRIFGRMGFTEGISGHCTLRDPILTDHFWVNPLALDFGSMTVSDLLLISPEGEIVMGGKADRQQYNRAAFPIHHALHSARPDANAACHLHSLHGKAWCAFGRKLDMFCQDSCAFYGDQLGLYDDFGGVVLSDGEGERIAAAAGPAKGVLLVNHGLLTVGKTIREACFWFIVLERLCQTQLLIEAAAAGGRGLPRTIRDEVAEWTGSVTGSHVSGYHGAEMYYTALDKDSGGEYKQ